MASPALRAFFDEASNTVSYLAWNARTRRGAVIDPVLDFDPASGVVGHRSANKLLDAAAREGVAIDYSLETHVHADHLSAAPYVKARAGAKTAIGERVREVQAVFAPLFGADDLGPDGGDFDLLLGDGETLDLGDLTIEVIHTPGHTPADVAYRIGDVIFVGDTMFMPDYGSARCDFPGGDARMLYRSARRILSHPDETRLFMCHDYKAPGRDCFAWETTVGEQRRANPHLGDAIGEEEFVALRTARDATLAPPKLLICAIQVNIRAGRFPPPDAAGARFLRLPVVMAEASDDDALA